jgi:serine/threonine-protein kinase
MLFLSIGITLLFLWLALFPISFFENLELKRYDLMMGLRSQPEASSDIVMVDIDDDSIEKLGRWPWPRSLIAKGIDAIDAGNPRVIGLNFVFSEPEESSGLRELRNLEADLRASLLPMASPAAETFLQALQQAMLRLDNDRKLTTAMERSAKVVLPIYFKESAIASQGDDPGEAIRSAAIGNARNPQGYVIPVGSEAVAPIEQFTAAADGLGHINLAYDRDGTARRERLLYQYRGVYVPSYTLTIAAKVMNLSPDRIQTEIGSWIRLGSIEIPTTTYSEMLVSFKGPRGSFKRFSYFDVINGKVPANLFKNKIVLVAASATGILNPLSTSVDPTMPVGEFSANTVWAMLNQQFIRQPFWSETAALVLILAVGAIIALLPRIKAKYSALVFVLLFCLLFGGSAYLFAAQGLWVPVTYPTLQLILGYIGAVSLSYFVTETRKEKVEGESAETNRMLGLSFQSQGMLDMAFDKFRRCPVDDEMKNILYNLALDFERKRQLNKAAAVYELIEETDSGFKDVTERKKRLLQASETMVFGDGMFGSGSSGDGLMSTATGTRPTLGRYEVIKQLGKGAMGTVYLGQDPRIHRTTAIKTFRFSDDFEPEEAEQLKEKFFREAESAGTLSHPNIVTIYDAGDEQDLAYIAMEFLEGSDLEKHVRPGGLLPMRKVIGYAADIADALGYAHDKGIVHRDIKPANIMLLASGVVKITDFGIARITATSQTQTGVVKGTPYYMSPEQISGEKVDGRSDIFSLGVMLYQMLTGELPFKGDNPAALMHQIMNVAHPDPRQFNPKIVKPLVFILNKALEKDRSKRYQKAGQMAAHLRELGKKLDEVMMKKRAKDQG